MRAIDDDIRPVYTEKRLSRNLNNDALAAPIEQAILKDGARSVTSDTLLLVDPTEIRKEFSYKMQYVTRVRDASRSSKENCEVLVNGYHETSWGQSPLLFTLSLKCRKASIKTRSWKAYLKWFEMRSP